LGLPVGPEDPLFVNLERPPVLAALREGTVRDKVDALQRRGIGPAGWTAHWLRHSHASALLLAGTPDWVVSRRLGTPAYRPLWTYTAGSARTRPCGRRRTGRRIPRDGGPSMTSERTAGLRVVPAAVGDPAAGLLADLPPEWHGEVVGPGIKLTFRKAPG
jgi:hypothetical protein